MCIGIIIDDDTGIQKSRRINRTLDSSNDLICFTTPFCLHKWSHISSCSMFSLEGSVIFMYCKFNYVTEKAIIPFYLFRDVERLSDHKMNIAIFRMSENY